MQGGWRWWTLLRPGRSHSALSARPQKRMAQRKVAHDFGRFGICFETLPGCQIFGLLEFQSREQQAWLAHGPLVPVKNIVRPRPLRLVLNKWKYERHRFLHAAPVRQLKCPEIVIGR